jgi:hypothetical protein
MKKRILTIGLNLLIVLFVLNFSACKKKPAADETTATEELSGANSFKSEEIGWSIIVPQDWEIINQDELKAEEEIGRELAGETVEEQGSKLNFVVSFRRDEFNFLSATTQAFTEEYPGEYQDNNRLINELIYNTFMSQGIQVETTKDSTEIGGKQFSIYTNKIFDANGEVFITQELYSCLINGYDFAVNLAYNNDTYKEEMLEALRKSKFKSL